MAVYNIFASADASLYSLYPGQNTGRDPILEVSVRNSQVGVGFLDRVPLTQNPYYSYELSQNANYTDTQFFFPTTDIRRSILQFSSKDVSTLYSFVTQSVSGTWSASLQMFLADASNLSTTYSLQAYAVTKSWSMGTGMYANTPPVTNGVSWTYTGASGSSPAWVNPGGDYTSSLSGSQQFDYMSSKDINMDVTDVVDAWFSGSTNNFYSMIVKHPNYVEQNTGSFVELKFFSVDTHTIYPPTLQFKWNDAYYFPAANPNYVLDDEITIVLANNPGQFRQNQAYKMRTAVRQTYPVRQFTTSSVYLNALYLSEQTYWALQDVKTEEMIVDFDPIFTALSADSVSNYFTLYTSGLEVNRFYRILIKTNIYSTTYGPLSTYNSQQSIYNALSLYGPSQLALLPAETVIYSGENLVFKIIE
jgi:hypothetical protein